MIELEIIYPSKSPLKLIREKKIDKKKRRRQGKERSRKHIQIIENEKRREKDGKTDQIKKNIKFGQHNLKRFHIKKTIKKQWRERKQN